MKKLLWIILPLLIVSIYALNIYPFLSNSHPVKNADVLVVEGWLPPELLDNVIEEFKIKNYKFIATTGVPLAPEFRMTHRGYLIFDLKEYNLLHKNDNYKIEVEAYSTPLKNIYAEMGIMVNDSLVFEISTTAEIQKYSVELKLDSLKSLTIRYKNDEFGGGEDRDLMVGKVTINNTIFDPRSEYVKFDIGDLGGEDIQSANFKSVAEEAALVLQRKGIPKAQIVAVPTEEREINRTYNSALAFGSWLDQYPTKSEIRGINIISMGTHSRRSWILFKQHISEDIPVGIISLKTSETPNENWWRTTYGIKRVLIESVKYVYTLFL